MTRTERTWIFILMLVLLGAPMSLTAKKKGIVEGKAGRAAPVERIWRNPGAVRSLNLLYGAGGKGHAPNPKGTFTFVKEDPEATSPKFDVKDGQGIEWKVKLGEEPQSETAASRLLWAAGYFVDEDYYLATFTVRGMEKLHRGDKFVEGDVVRKARLERKTPGVKKLDEWEWFKNPFVGTRELNGLRVMMSLVNNWDLAPTNNSIERVGGEARYVVSDLGATFGNTGNSFTRSKSDPEDFEESKFIANITPDFVDCVMHSRPFFLSAINVPNYRDRTEMERITKHIPRADAKWLGDRLAMLSAKQIRDAFRAAGYAPADVETYAQTIEKRIAELEAL